MITKTEVLQAIAESEPFSGWSTLDQTPTRISKGALHALVEAAKCARYRKIAGVPSDGFPPSNSDAVLDDKDYAMADNETDNLI